MGADRLIFGSNAQGGIPKIGVMVFEYSGLTEEEKRLALGENLSLSPFLGRMCWICPNRI